MTAESENGLETSSLCLFGSFLSENLGETPFNPLVYRHFHDWHGYWGIPQRPRSLNQWPSFRTGRNWDVSDLSSHSWVRSEMFGDYIQTKHFSHHLINNNKNIYPLGLMEPQPGSGSKGDNSRILGVVVLSPWSVCHLQLLGMAAMVPGMGYDWGANGHQLGIFWSFWMVPTINYFRDNFDGYADTQLLSVLSRESDQLGPHFIRQ